MKKLLIILLSTFALTLSYGQGTGPNDDPGGSGPAYGSGPGEGFGWEGAPDVDLPPEIVALREQIQEKRQLLKQDRDALLAQLQEQGATDEEVRAALLAWREEHAGDVGQIRELAQQIRNYFRENRPERPDPVVTQAMMTRRERFRTNTQEIVQLRQQLRTMDPEDEACQELRQQLQQKLQERKVMLRHKRTQEGGGAGGDRRGQTGG